MAKVDTQHPLFKQNITAWNRVRDCVAGSPQIKGRDTLYLPLPTGMVGAPPAAINRTSVGSREQFPLRAGDQDFERPSFSTNEAYENYKQRAHFPDLTSDTLRGLMGVSSNKNPIFNLPSRLEYLLTDAKKDGSSLLELYFQLIEEVVQVGRIAISIDIDPETGNLIFITYTAESFINWKRKEQKTNNLMLAVFEETRPTNENIFSQTTTEVHRVLIVNEEGFYETALWKDGEVDPESIITPSIQGRTFNKVPVVVLGSTNLDPDPDKIPLLGISDVSVQIYMKNADLNNAEFLTCNPTLVLSGADTNETPQAMGSTVALTLSNPAAKVYYTKTDTSGLDHCMNHIQKLFGEAEKYGAAILGDNTTGPESAEALRVKQASRQASLMSIVRSVSQGLNVGIKLMGEWLGVEVEEKAVDPPERFAETLLSDRERMQLVSEWQNGAISMSIWRHNLRKGGIIPEDVVDQAIEDEFDQGVSAITGEQIDESEDKSNTGDKIVDDSSPEGE